MVQSRSVWYSLKLVRTVYIQGIVDKVLLRFGSTNWYCLFGGTGWTLVHFGTFILLFHVGVVWYGLKQFSTAW